MLVISIMAALAALTMGSMRFAQNRGAISSTKALLKTVELALEKYHLEYGEYPAFAGTGGPTLNGFDSRGAWLLYEVMTGDGNKSRGGTVASDGNIAATEKPLLEGIFSGNDDRFNNVEKDSAGNFVLIDRWGNPLQYRRADDVGYTSRNGTYDLWSMGTEEDGVVGGEGKWIKNW